MCVIYKEYLDAIVENLQRLRTNFRSKDSNSSTQSNGEIISFSLEWSKFSSYFKEIEMVESKKSKLDVYLYRKDVTSMI